MSGDPVLCNLDGRDEGIFAENIKVALKTEDIDRDYRRNFMRDNWNWQKSVGRLEKLLKDTIERS